MQAGKGSWWVAALVFSLAGPALGDGPKEWEIDFKAANNKRVEISWDQTKDNCPDRLKDKASVKVERRVPPGSDFSLIATIAKPDANVGQKTISDELDQERLEATYRLTVQVDGKEVCRAEKKLLVAVDLPVPSHLTAVPSERQVHLKWAYSGPEAQFEVHRAGADASVHEKIQRSPTEAGVTEIYDLNLAPGTSFTYRVRALRQGEPTLVSKWTDQVVSKTNPEGWYYDAKILSDNRYDPDKVNRITTCTWRTDSPSGAKGWQCDPAQAVYVSAAEGSTVFIVNPPGKVTRIRAELSGLAMEGCNGQECSGALGFHEVLFAASASPQVLAVDLYRLRNFKPSFSDQWFVSSGEREDAVRALRAADSNSRSPASSPQRPEKTAALHAGGPLAEENHQREPEPPRTNERASLITRSQDTGVIITLTFDDGRELSLPPIDIVYQRWWIDIGGFYAFRDLSDSEIVTAPLTETTGGPARVQVLRVTGRRDWESETGVMTTFFPANYPWLGLSFGIADNSGRSLSYYLGPSIRLMGRRGGAVATFATGISLAPVRRYPGVNVKSGDLAAKPTGTENYLYESTSPLLQGEIRNETSFFVAVTLGFALDRRSAKSSPAE